MPSQEQNPLDRNQILARITQTKTEWTKSLGVYNSNIYDSSNMMIQRLADLIADLVKYNEFLRLEIDTLKKDKPTPITPTDPSTNV